MKKLTNEQRDAIIVWVDNNGGASYQVGKRILCDFLRENTEEGASNGYKGHTCPKYGEEMDPTHLDGQLQED